MDFRDPASIPIPTTDDEFERFCLLIARDRYGAEFYRYARTGQAQHGIDIYSAYYKGKCLQCKLHKKPISDAKLIDELKEDLGNAKNKFNDLKKFIFTISVETRPTIQDACKKLSDDKTQVIPWFWNQLQEDIARSKWLLRYCLNYEPGAQWISDDFIEQERKKGDIADWQPLQYYSSNMNLQWYGVLKNWDAPRQHYRDIRQSIANSFAEKYSDMPVSAIVRGEGGSGKSVLLRRLAIDLRNTYTVYWIADNANDFLKNEWLYDIDNNPNEKYLLVLEDWYRNFSSTGDRVTANRLLQKIRRKPNVRLLIGDRLSQSTYYPKINSIIFDLKNEENATLLSYVIDIVPDWKDKFTKEQKEQLLKTGLFQLLFTYQYAPTNKPFPKAENYFFEIIQSDYRQLVKNESPFSKGLAYALVVYAHIYTDFGTRITTEALIVLAESYSYTKRPFVLKQDVNNVVKEPVLKKYVDIVEINSPLFGEIHWLYFLHDTLADQGWRYLPINSSNTFGSSIEIAQILYALKSEKTAYDLSFLLYQALSVKPGLLSKAQIMNCCDYLISIRSWTANLSSVLFREDVAELTYDERVGYLHLLAGSANKKEGFWVPIVVWIGNRMKGQDRIDILCRLVEAGNVCDSVLVEYFRLINKSELSGKIGDFFTEERLLDPFYVRAVPMFLNRVEHDEEISNIIRKYLKSPEPEKVSQNFTVCLRLLGEEDVAKEAARKYLKSPEPEKVSQNFTVCLRLLGEEDVAKEAARKYLKSPEPEKVPENFTVCLRLLGEEDVAKEAARKYLKSPEPEKVPQNFTVCLRLLGEEDVAKEAARKYLKSPEPEKVPENFTVCLKVLGAEVADIVARIMKSSLEGQDYRIIYHALQIASEIEYLDIITEDKVHRILKAKQEYYDKAGEKKYHLYLQMMKVPLFRIRPWRAEVDRLLQNFSKIHRNLFYSLTFSHMKQPEPLAEACSFYLRNWKQEFKQPKKYWGYFIRCLAHPVILEQADIKEEISQLCNQMLLADNCPSEIRNWLQSITKENIYPQWERTKEEEL